MPTEQDPTTVPAPTPAPTPAPSQLPYLTYEQMNIINEFRFHVLELAIWGRSLALSLKYKLPDTEAIYARLLEVPSHFYDSMSTFYGQEIAEQFLNLLTQHLISFRTLTEALLSGDQAAADASLKQFYANADQISEFFARLSPFWDKRQWQNLLYQYIQMIYYHIQAIVTENHAMEIQIFDRIQYHTVLLGDYLARGVLYQLASLPAAPAAPAAPQTPASK